MRILLLGVTGQVGWELARTLSVMGELITTGRGGSGDLQLDASDLRQLQATLDSTAPDVVVNATAYTAVDRAEDEPERAMLLNAEVPGLIGAWAAMHGALVIHYSTDYVFDGSKDTPYVETDATNPVSVYGRSKLAGDQALLASGCAALILRVSWVYGMRGSNFLLTMRRLMHERSALNIVDDQVGAPTWCRTIAQVTATALARMPDAEGARQALCGVYHLSPGGSTRRFGFATAIQDALGLQCDLHPIPSSEYPTPAGRPMNSRMDAGKLEKTFGLELPGWERDLALCLDEQVD
jgi:dTDP-4-dehydrorhamnose reductase